jgi:hypothetical protein
MLYGLQAVTGTDLRGARTPNRGQCIESSKKNTDLTEIFQIKS